jgi:hypothetical protein
MPLERDPSMMYGPKEAWMPGPQGHGPFPTMEVDFLYFGQVGSVLIISFSKSSTHTAGYHLITGQWVPMGHSSECPMGL